MNDRFLFPIAGHSMATNFRVKMGEIGLLTFILRLGIPKRIGISQCQIGRVNIGNDLHHV